VCPLCIKLNYCEPSWLEKSYNTEVVPDIPDEEISEIELIAVEEDSGDIAQNEDTDNTDEDEGKIDFCAD
jgi:hypothetical protein